MFPLRRAARPYVIGHRGAGIRAPENTLAAFRRSPALGVDIVECDVRLTRDAAIVVIHDDRVDRTTNGTGRVRDLTLAAIRQLDAGQGEPVPTLEEVLAWAAGEPRVGIAIELKPRQTEAPGLLTKVVFALQDHDLLERAIVVSFDGTWLPDVKVQAPSLATGLLSAQPFPHALQAARDCRTDSLWPKLDTVSPAGVGSAHRHNLAVITWLTNTPPDIRRACDADVDGMGTDVPDLVRDTLDARKRSIA